MARQALLTANSYRNATFSALNQTQGYLNVLEEVGKYNVHLNYFERLWAVRLFHLSPKTTRNPNTNN